MIKRLAAVVGIVVFSLLAGVGVSYAYWADNVQIGSTVGVVNPAADNCSLPAVTLTNGSFETPVTSGSTFSYIGSTEATPWVSVLRGTTTAERIEVWKNGYNGIASIAGQFIELNSEKGASTIYQDLATVAGQTLNWGFWHRGRMSSTVGDTVRVTIGSTTTSTTTGGSTFTTTNSGWKYYSGSYVVPAGQTTTRLAFTAVSAAASATGTTLETNGTLGNFIDDVTLGTGPCVTASSTVTNVTTGSTSAYRVGETVRYVTTVTNSGGAAAGSSVAKITLPAGLAFVSGSIKVGTTTLTDATGDDQAEYDASSSTVIARIGTGATSSAGGSIINGSSATVTYDAVIAASAADGSITHTPQVEFVDAAIPSWTLSITGATLTTAVAAAADVSVVVSSSPTITAGASVSWSFRVTNNGPSAAAGVTVALALTSGPTYSATTYTTSDEGSATANCTGTGTSRSCAIGAIPSGQGRTVTVTAALPANPSSLYPVTATATSSSYDYVSTNNAATNTGVDGVAPVISSFSATRSAATSIQLSWSASDVGGGIASYEIYQNGIFLQNVTAGTTSLLLAGRTANTAYVYRLVAKDVAGNTAEAIDGAVTFSTTANYYRVTFAGDGSCVNAAGTSSVALSLVACASSNNQRWTVNLSSGDLVRLQPVTGSTRRWSATSDTAVVGTNVQAATGVTTANRSLWDMNAVLDGTTSYVHFINQQTGFCAAVSGTAVVQATCSGSDPSQRFLLVVY